MSNLKEMMETGEKHSAKPIGKTIAKVKFQFGYSSYTRGHSTSSLFRGINSQEDCERVSNEVTAHSTELGGNSKAVWGLKYTVPPETVLSFEAEWLMERFIDRFSDEDDFYEIYNAIDELTIPINEWVWCAYHRIESPTALAKGEAGKYKNQSGDMVYPRIIVPLETFADEAAARAAVATSGGGGADNSGWSEKAVANYGPDMSNLISQKGDIEAWLEKARQGTPFNNDAENHPLPKKISPPTPANQAAYDSKLVEYIAKIWDIDTTDMDQLVNPVPF